jgi:hypothetical protein
MTNQDIRDAGHAAYDAACAEGNIDGADEAAQNVMAALHEKEAAAAMEPCPVCGYHHGMLSLAREVEPKGSLPGKVIPGKRER